MTLDEFGSAFGPISKLNLFFTDFFVFFVFWVIYADDSRLMMHHWWRHDDVICQWHTGTGPTPKKNIKKTKFAKNCKILKNRKYTGRDKITNFYFYLQKIQRAKIVYSQKAYIHFIDDLKNNCSIKFQIFQNFSMRPNFQKLLS